MRKGFSLIEVLLVMALVSALLGFVVVNVFKPQSASTLASTTNQLITDLRSQQLKSMAGETGTLEASPSGVFFGTDSYTLFSGGHFQSGDPNNFEIQLPTNVRFSRTTFPGGTVVFATGSGEIIGYASGSDTVTLEWNKMGLRTIKLNKYGSTTEVF